ncbi:hypothetical protein MKW94_009039 [Papaver nudicaule]|uniref:Uncharacterized protein n=1 Tax=Papaver nudicaule TaxID=74823 RepID=A0AA41V7F7_PAPNU|nr:hypothetical protein [Papaver nudicaule]
MMASNGALPAGNPIAVISPQFCAPYPVEFAIAKKITIFIQGNYDVFQVRGNNMFKVRGTPTICQRRRVLFDAAGVPLVSLQQKVWSAHNRWEVYRGDSSHTSDLLFSVKKSSILQLRTSLHVFLASNTAEKVCDFKIKGNSWDEFAVYQGNSDNSIAKMHKKHPGRSVFIGDDTYSITVDQNVDYAFIAALCLVLNEIDTNDDDD